MYDTYLNLLWVKRKKVVKGLEIDGVEKRKKIVYSICINMYYLYHYVHYVTCWYDQLDNILLEWYPLLWCCWECRDLPLTFRFEPYAHYIHAVNIFSAPEPKAQVHYCDHALSVVRPSLTFHIFDFSSDTTEQNSTKLDRKQELNIFYRVCVFRADRKIRWPPWPLIGWDIFDFSSKTAERNSTKLDGKQDLNVLYQVCVFWADRKNKMAALLSDWLRHFRLLL